MADPIKHVVLLMLENHSFDQMLGCMQTIFPTVDGVPRGGSPRTNIDLWGRAFPQTPTTTRQMDLDPKHEFENVEEQIADGNSGFTRNFSRHYPHKPAECGQIMQYYDRGALPALHALAENYLLCDHWFSSLPGPTWPNRFFVLTGTSNGRVDMPDGLLHPDISAFLAYNQDTIFDRLNDAGINWKVYFHDIPQSLALTHQRRLDNVLRYHHITEFHRDAAGNENEFPKFSFIEPRYDTAEQNDDHPPHDIMRAQKLIADVYNSLRADDTLWNSTLLVVLYDEHGGFYDHVPPPATVTPDNSTDSSGFKFDRLGVRVPALIASPYAPRDIFSTVLDHTSLLHYLCTKWNLPPLGARTAVAADFSAKLLSAPRTDVLPVIDMDPADLNPPDLKLDARAIAMESDHQSTLNAFAAALRQSPESPWVIPALQEIRQFGKVTPRMSIRLRAMTPRLSGVPFTSAAGAGSNSNAGALGGSNP